MLQCSCHANFKFAKFCVIEVIKHDGNTINIHQHGSSMSLVHFSTCILVTFLPDSVPESSKSLVHFSVYSDYLTSCFVVPVLLPWGKPWNAIQMHMLCYSCIVYD